MARVAALRPSRSAGDIGRRPSPVTSPLLAMVSPDAADGGRRPLGRRRIGRERRGRHVGIDRDRERLDLGLLALLPGLHGFERLAHRLAAEIEPRHQERRIGLLAREARCRSRGSSANSAAAPRSSCGATVSGAAISGALHAAPAPPGGRRGELRGGWRRSAIARSSALGSAARRLRARRFGCGSASGIGRRSPLSLRFGTGSVDVVGHEQRLAEQALADRAGDVGVARVETGERVAQRRRHRRAHRPRHVEGRAVRGARSARSASAGRSAMTGWRATSAARSCDPIALGTTMKVRRPRPKGVTRPPFGPRRDATIHPNSTQRYRRNRYCRRDAAP